jgi:hypothetical protein
VFALIEPVPGAPKPPGPWTVRPAPVSFSSVTAPEQVWRADLSSDPFAARVALGVAREQLRAQEAALATAEARMQRAAASGLSFSAGMRGGAPEQTLQSLLRALHAEPVAPTGGTSFSTREAATPAAWIAAEEQFRTFVAQARETISTYALIETRQDRLLIGRTRVNWGGDMRSYLSSGVSYMQAELHRRTLTLALRSRAAILRVFGIVLRGARIVAQMISSPIGVVTALPAAWSFVQDVLSEVRTS